MAIVQIPIGGRMVPIEVPDFAMEQTQQDVLDVQRQQLAQLQAIAGESRAARSQPQQGDRKVEQAIERQTKTQTRETRTLGAAVQDLQRYSQEQNLSTVVSGIAGSVSSGLSGMFGPLGGIIGGIGTAAGFFISALEKYGEALSKARRVGLGVGESLIDLRDSAALAGLTLDQFTAIAATNGTALRALGDNTGEGALRLGQLSQEFRNLTMTMGNFGMSNDEIAAILLEEVELRRVTLGQQNLQAMSNRQLAASVRDNIAQQEAMARLTGQDVRDRLMAQRQMQNNVIAQEYMSTATEETRQRLMQFSAALSAVPGGDRITNALINSLATGADPRAFEAQLFAMMGQPAQQMIDFFMQNINNAGMGSAEFGEQAAILASNLRNSGGQMGNSLVTLAAFGDETASAILAIRNQTVQLADSNAQFSASYRENLNTILNTTQLITSGINSQFDTAMALLTTRVADVAAALFGVGEAGTGVGLIQGLGALNQQLAQLDLRTPIDDAQSFLFNQLPESLRTELTNALNNYANGNVLRVEIVGGIPLPGPDRGPTTPDSTG